VGHHGSATSTAPELLAEVQPRIAVISVGARNSFHLPNAATVKRLADSGILVYRTDIEGAVTFYLDGHSVTPWLAALH